MPRIEKSIDVAAPVRTVYNQWTQFEEFPRFMEGVKSVRQVDDKRLEWKAEVAGKDVAWSAEILEQVPDRRISWRSTSGKKNAGVVSFAPARDGNGTRVTLALDYDPEGAAENVGSAVGLVSGRVEGDLERFKKFLEARGRETGGWRGEIRGGSVLRDDPPSAAPPTSY
jgi:uncharacterized membrane protein